MPSDVLSFEMPLMRHRGKTKMPSRNSRGYFCIRYMGETKAPATLTVPGLVASDVAKAFGYERPNDAVNAHCKKVNKFSYGESPRGAQPFT